MADRHRATRRRAPVYYGADSDLSGFSDALPQTDGEEPDPGVERGSKNHDPDVTPAVQTKPIVNQRWIESLRDQDALRRAFVMREILDRPVSLRRPVRRAFRDR